MALLLAELKCVFVNKIFAHCIMRVGGGFKRLKFKKQTKNVFFLGGESIVSSLCLHQQAKKSRISASNDVLDKSRGAACFGSSCLTQLLTSLAANTKSDASLRVGIVGKRSFFLI